MKVQLYAYRLIYISANRLSFSAVLGGNATHLLPTYRQARRNRLKHRELSAVIANSNPIHNPRQGNYFVAVGPVIFFCFPYPTEPRPPSRDPPTTASRDGLCRWATDPHRGGRPRAPRARRRKELHSARAGAAGLDLFCTPFPFLGSLLFGSVTLLRSL